MSFLFTSGSFPRNIRYDVIDRMKYIFRQMYFKYIFLDRTFYALYELHISFYALYELHMKYGLKINILEVL